VELPYWLAAGDDTVGYSNAVLQPDGLVRWAMIRYRDQGTELKSLAYQTYLRYSASLGQEPLPPETLQDAFLIDYAGDTGDFEAISLDLVLGGRIDPIVFKDCAVLIGAYTTGLQDNFFIGTNRKAPLYGVEIHADILQNLMESRQVLPADPLLVAGSTALLAALFYLLTLRKKLLLTTLVALGIIGGYLLSAKLLFDGGWALPLIYLPLFILLLYAYQYLKLYFAERLHRTRLSNAFKKYVAPQVVDQLAKDQKFELKLGGELRNIAVLFIDIRGFTPLSESLPPQDVVSILNEYFALVTRVIFDHGGTLDKFIGDAVMAVFNAPMDLEDYEYRAVCTALDIVAGAADLERKLLEKHQKDVGFGIGVNCGEAVVGNIGCGFRMDYTAIGDTVNTAARLESNAKRGQILIPERLYRKVEERIVAEEIGVIPLKGKAEGALVYNVKCRKQGSDE
jgi:adenylate cyclase